MKLWKLILVVFFGAALVVSAHAGQKKDKSKKVNAAKKEVVAASDAAAAANSAAAPEYVIGPEDVLNINVWKEPELTGTVPVRPDGKISMALLNDVQAAGLTPMQLTEQLTAKLKKYLENPTVNVTVSAIKSQRIYIVGQVLHSGTFDMTPQMTVLQAISTAGGLGEFANGSKIYVLRTENGVQTKLPFDYKAVLKGEKGDENIVLKPGDTIVVP